MSDSAVNVEVLGDAAGDQTPVEIREWKFRKSDDVDFIVGINVDRWLVSAQLLDQERIQCSPLQVFRQTRPMIIWALPSKSSALV